MKTYNWEGVNPDGYFIDKLEPRPSALPSFQKLFQVSATASSIPSIISTTPEPASVTTLEISFALAPISEEPYRFFFLWRRRPPTSTLFPYTTLFRSRSDHERGMVAAALGEPARLHPVVGAGEERRIVHVHVLVPDERPQQFARLEGAVGVRRDMMRSEEHTSELQVTVKSRMPSSA